MKVSRTKNGELKIVLNESEEALLEDITLCNTVETLTEYGVDNPEETDEFLDDLFFEIQLA